MTKTSTKPSKPHRRGRSESTIGTNTVAQDVAGSWIPTMTFLKLMVNLYANGAQRKRRDNA